MRWNRWIGMLAGALLAGATAVATTTAAAAPPDPPEQCRVNAPPGLWPGDYVDLGQGEWDANLHSGLNSDWTKQVRPIGRVRALMIFVDFSDAQAVNANPNQGGRDWRLQQSYWDFLKQSVDFFNASSNGRFQLDVDLATSKWFRMPKPTTGYGMTRATFSIANQKAYAREAVLAADPDVDFSPYDLVYIMPPRNATQIAFSPELNLYTDKIEVDGTVVKNGATYGQDMFTWGPKIVNHETGHAISLPESYNGGVSTNIHNFVGGWDLMGNILGHAPEYMAWNKWKLGWLDDPDFGCLASDGSAEYTLSPVSTAPDGGVTKKGVVIRTSPTTALIAELRAPLGNDATETVSPGAHRMCDWGVLLYTIDVTILNAYGTVKVVDAMPGSTAAGCTGDPDIATLGKGQGDGPSHFEDPVTGTTFDVLSIADSENARLRVTRAITRIAAAPPSGLSVALTGTHFNAPVAATYTWDFGDGTIGDGANLTHAFPAPGRREVTLTVRDGATVLGTAKQTVTTYAPATGTVTVTAPATSSAGGTATAQATFAPDAASAVAGQDATIEVYRRSPLTPRPAGITTGTSHLQVTQNVVPLAPNGTASLTYSAPVAATDVVVACINGGQPCVVGKTLVLDGAPVNLKSGVSAGTAAIEWAFTPGAGGWSDLWDGETLAGWSGAGTGSITRNFLTSLATAGGASSANPGTIWYSARQFKDFELSVDYRTIATNNNGGVFLRFPAPATVNDIDRNGYQVAILDSGSGATPAAQRSGSITQERVTPTTFASAPSTLTATYKPTREWNTLTIRAVRSHIQVYVNGVLASTYDNATRNGRAGYIGLENAGNTLMYRNVRVREFAPDTVAPTITVDSPADGAQIRQGAALPLTFACADESEPGTCTATLDGTAITSGSPLPTAFADVGVHTLVVDAVDAEGNRTVKTVHYTVYAFTDATGSVGGVVGANLSLVLGPPPAFGAFTPGVTRDYTASTTATVVSTAGDAQLTVADPGANPGHLVNGVFSLPQALQARAGTSAFAPVGGSASPTSLRGWSAPASNDLVTIDFRQSIAATDALRTGTYAKTLTFTLSTTTP